MSYVIYLLTSPPLRAPSVLGRIISSCPLKTIETLSLGFFTRPSAPPPDCAWQFVLICQKVASTTDYSYLFCLRIFLCSCKPLCICVKGGLYKRRLDLTALQDKITIIYHGDTTRCRPSTFIISGSNGLAALRTGSPA